MIVVYGKGEVGEGLSLLLNKLDIKYILMDDSDYNYNVLNNSKTIIVSPGISPKHKLYQQFGTKILSEFSFLGKLKKENEFFNNFMKNFIIIGITGTNGKSTTSWILYNTMKSILDKNNKFDIYITGNFKPSLSTTLFDLLDKKHQKKTFLVIEVSSFMLYNLQDWFFDYGVLINISKDHLDWHSDFEEYLQCKENILNYSEYILDGRSFFENNDLIGIYNPYFLGEYNQKNFNLVLDICKQIYYKYLENNYKDNFLNIDNYIEQLFDIMSDIKPLPHRLQLYKSFDGIDVYDDGICTSSSAQEQALKSFDEKVLLICGGADKGDSFDYLDNLYLDKVGFAVCLGTKMALNFMKQFKRLGIPCIQVNNMKDCIKQSLDNAKKNNLTKILFSPGCASFDIFKNVYDRCEQFEKEIKLIIS